MNEREPLARLTEREKVCLRHWFQHRSAKEIAVDLGISHHAVEKRLKMARTKLGTSTSLEAARMLVESEGYGRAVPQTLGLPGTDIRLHPSLPRSVITGALIMTVIAAIALALMLHPAAPAQQGAPQTMPLAQDDLSANTVPNPGTEAAVRGLVAGLASGAPDYAKLSPPFADLVRRDLPFTHRLFASMGALQSVTYRGHDPMGRDLYDLTFANGAISMSAALDADGRNAGGVFGPTPPRAR